MKILLKLTLLLFLISNLANAELINVNPDKDGEPWYVGGLRKLTKEDLKKISKFKKLTLNSASKNRTLPSRQDNSQNKFFRPIFSQLHGSCGQASGVGYTFTYEINYERDLAANTFDTQYPTHYTYNFLNNGSGNNGSWYFDGWEIIKTNGCPNVDTYGGYLANTDTEWMSGYDKYIASMENRVQEIISIDVSTPEGLELLKHWFVHHNNDEEYGGIVNFAAGASNYTTDFVANGLHEAGKMLMTKWGPQVNHAMTFVGYDER